MGLVLGFVGVVIFKTFPVNAQGINPEMSFQGKVVNDDGTNVTDGNYDFVFKIYTVDTLGTAVWTESKSLAVTDGIFQTNLGDTTALPGSVDFNSESLYLGVEFNSDGEMSPRIRLTASAYAFNAQKVNGLTVTNTTGTLTVQDATTITFSGAYDVTLVSSASTNVTLPTTGTLATLDGAETLTNKTIGSSGLTFSGANVDIDTASSEGLALQGRADSSFVTTAGNISFEAGGTGTTAVIKVGAGGSGSATPDFLALDVKSTSGDPDGGADGYMYYNASEGKFRCYQEGWTDCIGTGLGTESGPFMVTAEVIHPSNSTLDLVIGGTATESATFQVFAETGEASMSGKLTFSGGNRIETSEMQDLMLGGETTGAVLIQPSGDTTNFFKLISDGTDLSLTTTDGANLTVGAAGNVIIDSQGGGVSICNSSSCDTIEIGNNSDADTITIGDSNDGLTIASSTFNLSAGAVSGVTTFASSGDWTWAADTPTITINTDETFEISDAGGAFKFSVATGPEYTGDARPTRKVGLAPEFAGAVIVGDGSNNTGTMTSDFCEQGASAEIPDVNTGVCNTSGDMHNYYQWTTSEASAQDYQVYVRWRVPDNFSGWIGTDPMKVWGKRTDATNNEVRIFVYDTDGTLENSGGTQVAGTNWTQTSIESSFAGTYTAGAYMTIRIVVTADTNDSVQVGEITMDYLADN